MLSSIKAELEQYFLDNWVETPIQFEGVDFKQPIEWIALQFIPINRTATFGGRRFEFNQFKVLCYSDSPALSLQLVDTVNTFLDCKTFTGSYTLQGVPDGLGIQGLGNNVYETASIFEVNSLH